MPPASEALATLAAILHPEPSPAAANPYAGLRHHAARACGARLVAQTRELTVRGSMPALSRPHRTPFPEGAGLAFRQA